ncbi:recombinase family protein [Tolumonas auensis]|uniref:recombinase family protein n=1 Tax=Tolumonas auensis TaxID=43948 RepID=UPI002AA91FF1|nr:recombinase family protein [Tolumonas auensis]
MIRVYLRASTADQNAERAKELLAQFISTEMHDSDAVYYVENASGTKLERPVLNQLLNESSDNDVLLVESVDRLSRLTQKDWETLKAKVNAKGLRLVVRDLDTTHKQFESGITGDIMRVINSMLIDLMATMARLDNEKRIERTKQGIALAKAAKAKELGIEADSVKFGGRKLKDRAAVIELLDKGLTVKQIAGAANVGEATVYRIKKEIK